MLEVGENFVVLNMVQNVPANNVFKKFTGNTSQRNCSVVFSHNSVAFLENWCNVSQRDACATVIIKHNYMLMCNHKIVINIMLCLLNRTTTGHNNISQDL